ncbi:hypothetical protein FB567DRAFT_473861 [Paraphoma chrysanthemicola]|uniref:Ubiquitin-like domain-containing protein n=1 Tax=Paraphoma chrysanthemicola TaxID=798071 RepID=A0A8K0R2L9_9PLEO|nr:hypothetical protein FB567DRAFT_473861 [Paraphoma chrysanthemicola]
MAEGLVSFPVAEGANTGATASADFLQHTGTDVNTETTQPPTSVQSTTRLGNLMNAVTFVDHVGDSYVWPFERCRTWELARQLIEDIYKSRHKQHYVEVESGEYDLRVATSGSIVVPSLWSSIVNPSMDVRLTFRDSEDDRETTTRSENADLDEDATVLEPLGPRRDDERNYQVEERQPDASRDVDERYDYLYVSERRGDSEGSQQPLNRESESDSGESDEDSSTPGTDSPADENDATPPRTVEPPTDAEGHVLSFSIDTSRSMQRLKASSDFGGKNGAILDAERNISESRLHVETRRITKALLLDDDGKTMIQIHDLPGPYVPGLRSMTSTTWYHVKAAQLDFSLFRETCLGLPDLSNRTQILLRELLNRIEKHKVKRFSGGLFIEPGTVLRADEKCQPDPQSVIFMCIPYLDLQPSVQELSKSAARSFPARTLMQSLYPDERVQERDAEQAYRTFGPENSKNLIYVPNLWVIIIGTTTVVTHGHKDLGEEMVNSIQVVHENLTQLAKADITTDTITDIRLTDLDGRIHLYPLTSCRSYLQLEQKIFESTRRPYERFVLPDNDRPILPLAWKSSDGQRLIRPNDWPIILKRTDLVFIDILLLDTKRFHELYGKTTIDEKTPLPTLVSSDLVPPFLHWPKTSAASSGSLAEQSQSSTDLASERLEAADKSMLYVTLSEAKDRGLGIESAFATTAFYKSLPQAISTHVKSRCDLLISTTPSLEVHSWHDELLVKNCQDAAMLSNRFTKIAYTTLRLFVEDVDKGAILQKVSGALNNIVEIVAQVRLLGSAKPDLPSGAANAPGQLDTKWFIRARKAAKAPETAESKKLRRAVKHCRRCTDLRPFDSRDAAKTHLQSHLQTPKLATPVRDHLDERTVEQSSDGNPAVALPDWVIHEEQLHYEDWTDHIVKVLSLVCLGSFTLLLQAKDITDGVRDEHQRLFEQYSFPIRLTDVFSIIVIYYLAAERALHRAKLRAPKDGQAYALDDDSVLATLARFQTDASNSLSTIRGDLRQMVKSDPPPNVLQTLSLSTPYICGWLLRRLVVKPLEDQLTSAEMYRDYLSKIQFQVNHRPGKRLIRSINLLQEELQALLLVNSWQTKLAQNFESVLDDATYEKDIRSRKAMFPYERMLAQSCLDNLEQQADTYRNLLSRCNPLSDRTKQSLEINEEDHGKAIMVFTIVTIIFLPLSFVTSYFGMNTTDIRDMGSDQSLFWAVALPLTAVTMGTAMFIGYNGDGLRDALSALVHPKGSMAKSNSRREAGGLYQQNSGTSLDPTSLADNAEYARPRPEWSLEDYDKGIYQDYTDEEIDGETGPQTRMVKHTMRTTRMVTSAKRPVLAEPEVIVPYRTVQRRGGRTRLDQWDPVVESYPVGEQFLTSSGRRRMNDRGREDDDDYDPQLRTEPRVVRIGMDRDDDRYHRRPGGMWQERTRQVNGEQGYAWVKKRRARWVKRPAEPKPDYSDDAMF